MSTEEVTEANVDDVRAEIAGEVFNSAADVQSPAETQSAEEQHEKTKPDLWEGVPTAVRQELEDLRVKVGDAERIEYRVKQAESRIGSLLNEMHAAKDAAKAASNAPTAAQMEAAATSSEAWNELKTDYPEWTAGIDSRLAAERAEIMKSLPNASTIREEIQRESQAEISNVVAMFSERMVRMKHPKFDDKVKTPEFATWFEANGRPDSDDPLRVIEIFDSFDADMKAKKPTRQIHQERQQRLEQAQNYEGRRLPPTKSEADMSDAELRASIAKEVW